MKNTIKLNPWLITGFTDADGSFNLKYRKTKNSYKFQLTFVLGAHSKDTELLNLIQQYFEVGHIRQDKHKDFVYYTVSSVKDLIDVIIPHFDKYPLQTKKHADFILFKKAAFIHFKGRKNLEYLSELLGIKASMNWGLNDKLQEEFPDLVLTPRPEVNFIKPLHPKRISGFVTGDGSFLFSYIEKTSKPGCSVQLRFNLTQHIRDEELIRYLIEYFGCGKVSLNRNTYMFDVYNKEDNIHIIASFFKKYPPSGNKHKQFLLRLDVINILNNGLNKTKEGVTLLKDLKKKF